MTHIKDKPLSLKELQIAHLTSEGKTAKEIGVLLTLPTRTVEGRLRMLRKRYNASNNTHVVAILIYKGMLKTA